MELNEKTSLLDVFVNFRCLMYLSNVSTNKNESEDMT